MLIKILTKNNLNNKVYIKPNDNMPSYTYI